MSDPEKESPRRRPKGDKRARTRATLIQVAAQLVEEKGYEAVTLQEVGRRAGMSNGAIYGNFKNREDLLSAIGPTYWPQIRPQVPPGASFAEIMRAVAPQISSPETSKNRTANELSGLPGMMRPGTCQRSSWKMDGSASSANATSKTRSTSPGLATRWGRPGRAPITGTMSAGEASVVTGCSQPTMVTMVGSRSTSS